MKEIITQLEQELVATEARAAQLRTALAALNGGTVSVAPAAPPKPVRRKPHPNAGKRASSAGSVPKLEQADIAAVRDAICVHGCKTFAEIAGGTKLHNELVSKAILKLKRTGTIKQDGQKRGARYYPADDQPQPDHEPDTFPDDMTEEERNIAS